MQTKWLEDFVALSRSGGLSAAAADRNVTHPAFGRRIKGLEDWAGVPLLDRSTQPMSLNPAGQLFLASAIEVLDILRDTREALHQPEQQAARRVVIASGRTLSYLVLPKLLRHVASVTPAVQVQVVTTSLVHGMDMLTDGHADLLLRHAHENLPDRIDADGFAFCRVGSEKLVAVSAPLAPGCPRFAVPRHRQEVASAIPYLAYSAAMSLGKVLRSHLHTQTWASALQCHYEADSVEAIHAMALEGHGLAWLPWSLVQHDIEHNRLVRAATAAQDIELEVRLYMAQHNPKRQVRNLWHLLVRQFGGASTKP